MFCPACRDIEMHEVSKQGVLIDVCPRCRGVWLDRGELEKILAAGRSLPDYDEMYGEKQVPRPREESYERRHHDDDDYHKHKKHHKKKSFFNVFEDIFD